MLDWIHDKLDALLMWMADDFWPPYNPARSFGTDAEWADFETGGSRHD